MEVVSAESFSRDTNVAYPETQHLVGSSVSHEHRRFSEVVLGVKTAGTASAVLPTGDKLLKQLVR
jgi:hypothetical protein